MSCNWYLNILNHVFISKWIIIIFLKGFWVIAKSHWCLPSSSRRNLFPTQLKTSKNLPVFFYVSRSFFLISVAGYLHADSKIMKVCLFSVISSIEGQAIFSFWPWTTTFSIRKANKPCWCRNKFRKRWHLKYWSPPYSFSNSTFCLIYMCRI